MDPNACYRRMLDAMQGGDWTEAKAASEDLFTWLSYGGFYPEGTTKDRVLLTLRHVTRKTRNIHL